MRWNSRSMLRARIARTAERSTCPQVFQNSGRLRVGNAERSSGFPTIRILSVFSGRRAVRNYQDLYTVTRCRRTAQAGAQYDYSAAANGAASHFGANIKERKWKTMNAFPSTRGLRFTPVFAVH